MITTVYAEKENTGFKGEGYTEAEWCPHCEHEVYNLPSNFVGLCPHCKNILKPCSACDPDYKNCKAHENENSCGKFYYDAYHKTYTVRKNLLTYINLTLTIEEYNKLMSLVIEKCNKTKFTSTLYSKFEQPFIEISNLKYTLENEYIKNIVYNNLKNTPPP